MSNNKRLKINTNYNNYNNVPKFCEKLIKIIMYNIYRGSIEKPLHESRRHEVKNVEFCGFLKFDNHKHLYCNDGPVTKGTNEFHPNDGTFLNGSCDPGWRHADYIACIWHTHFEGTPIYPSAQDIMVTLAKKGTLEFIFTNFGFWIIQNVNVPDIYIKNKNETYNVLNNIYYINKFDSVAREKNINYLENYRNNITKYIDGLSLRFITWKEYFKTHDDQDHLYLPSLTSPLILKNK